MIWIGVVLLIFTFMVTIIMSPEAGVQRLLDAVLDTVIAAALLGVLYGVILWT